MKKTIFSSRENLGFYIFFTAAILLFLGDLVAVYKGFIAGDSLSQFYPWLKVYSESLKNFQFSYWTRYMHSGFPLMAEGQIGGFYPLNIVLFFLMPLKLAYNYSVVLHFILGGIFTYFYTKRIGAEGWGGALAAFLFCFGSAYAGCFYNIVTLKTLALFPLVLLLIEKYIDSREYPYIAWAGLICGCQFLAGFQQMAAYSFVFYMIYMLYAFRQNIIVIRKRVVSFIIFTVSSLIIASPQLMLTYNLAQNTDRSSQTLGFALWRSFPPPCFLGAVFPRMMDFFNADFYIGIFSILFLILALIYVKREEKIRPVLLIALIAILASLGKYNPLYTILLKITKFYSFRNPSKFLFFALFAVSVLSGFGFSKFFKKPDEKSIKLAAKIFTGVMGFSLLTFLVIKFVFIKFKTQIISLFQDYTLKNVYGKAHHRYDLQAYMEKARSLYTTLAAGMDLSNLFVVISIFFVILGLIAGILIIRKPNKLRFLRLPIFCLIFLDIFTYSFYGKGFRGNIEPFSSIKPTHGKILEVLKSGDEIFRIAPFGLESEKMPWWVRPNSNILVGLESIAAYTPLAESNYRGRLLSLEVVDNSLGLLPPSEKALAEKYQLLKLLNVKYVISSHRLRESFLKEVTSEGGIFLYELDEYLPRVFFTEKIKGDIRADLAKLDIISYRNGFLEAEISANKEGYLVFSENYYPGWEVSIDSNKADIVVVQDLVQAVRIGKGRHRVIFRFRPQFIKS